MIPKEGISFCFDTFYPTSLQLRESLGKDAVKMLSIKMVIASIVLFEQVFVSTYLLIDSLDPIFAITLRSF